MKGKPNTMQYKETDIGQMHYERYRNASLNRSMLPTWEALDYAEKNAHRNAALAVASYAISTVTPPKRRFVVIRAAVACGAGFVLGIMAAGGSEDTDQLPTPTSTSTQDDVVAARTTGSSIQDGTWEVGTGPGKIRPGTWRSSGGEGCYWARLRTTDGTLDSIIANSMPSGQAVVTIKPTDAAFESRGCGTWTRS